MKLPLRLSRDSSRLKSALFSSLSSALSPGFAPSATNLTSLTACAHPPRCRRHFHSQLDLSLDLVSHVSNVWLNSFPNPPPGKRGRVDKMAGQATYCLAALLLRKQRT